MKSALWAISILVVIVCLPAESGSAEEPQFLRIGGKEAVATVNGEPITAEDLNRALGKRHADAAMGNKIGKVDYAKILDRLINIRLILLEARNIGLDELPEVKESIASYSRGALMAVLLKQQTEGIRADDNEVERIYKESVKEYQLRSLFFEKEEDARRIEAEVKSGRDLDEIVREVTEEGIAKGAGEAQYLKQEHLLPEIRTAISQMEVGSTSPVLSMKQGFAILRLEGIRYPEDAAARENAKAIALKAQKDEAKLQFIAELRKEYVRVKQEILDSLDYESTTPGFQALLNDSRVVAEIQGDDPVTVAELSETIRKQFFHGTTKPAERKAINKRKFETLEKILDKRVVRLEALRQGIDKSEVYKNMVQEYHDSVLFGTFIEKVIRSGIRMEEKELEMYYETNLAEFSSPGMMRTDSIVFSRKDLAEEAIHKLKEGTDFSWLRANAEGLVDEKVQGLLHFKGDLTLIDTLPPDLQKAVSGALPGDFRLYESSEGHYYVLALLEVISPKPRSFEEIRHEIAKKAAGEKITRELEEYAAKLRKSYHVKIFLKSPAP